MAIINGNKDNISNEGTVLVDFWAPWCGPCKTLSPTLDQLSENVPGVTIVKINVDEYPEAAAEFDVMGVPTLILLNDGKEVGRKKGNQSLDTLKGFIDLKA